MLVPVLNCKYSPTIHPAYTTTLYPLCMGIVLGHRWLYCKAVTLFLTWSQGCLNLVKFVKVNEHGTTVFYKCDYSECPVVFRFSFCPTSSIEVILSIIFESRLCEVVTMQLERKFLYLWFQL